MRRIGKIKCVLEEELLTHHPSPHSHCEPGVCRQLAQGLWAAVLSVAMTPGGTAGRECHSSIHPPLLFQRHNSLSEVDTCPAYKLPLPAFLAAGAPESPRSVCGRCLPEVGTTTSLSPLPPSSRLEQSHGGRSQSNDLATEGKGRETQRPGL